MRHFHLCLSPETIESENGLLRLVAEAGIGDVWVTGFMYGYWHYSLERIQAALRKVQQASLRTGVGNVPLGHPGDSLGARSGDVPLTPPTHWRLGQRPDGATHAGTSLHFPATEENAEALRRLQSIGVERVFLDDDFRLAVTPGMIGGCFCDEHRQVFRRRYDYAEEDVRNLIEDVAHRHLTPRLRDWTEFTCDELSGSFRAQQAAAPGVQLGLMVMYLGAEKAGIRLRDYAGTPFRVGELMFDDASFAPIKGKTDELFSALFHRRFAPPELAYSETTAFPADQLSAANLAAKMNISLIADVRNTLFMSGLTPFPLEHWATLAPAMRQQAALHLRLGGHRPHGPLKHFWGEGARYVGDDNPYSLFLAMGVPFEVVDRLPADGWTFLCDADADADPSAGAAGLLSRSADAPGTTLVTREERFADNGVGRAVDEALPALFAFKHDILPHLRDTPFVAEDTPIVCAWYPTASSVLLWNLTDHAQTVTLRFREAARSVRLEALGVALLGDVV